MGVVAAGGLGFRPPVARRRRREEREMLLIMGQYDANIESRK
jgi:hypothetical protein